MSNEDGGTAPELPGAFAFPGESRCQLADIGSPKGGLTHLWPGRLSDEIEETFKIPKKRGKIALQTDLEFLDQHAPAIKAALIAREIYDGFNPEFNTGAYRLASILSGDIVARFEWEPGHDPEQPESEKWFIDFLGQNDFISSSLQELAWLQYAFDAGATAADLEAWGVRKFTIIQLIWWQRREGETRLQQHIRAIRNGWGLRYLEQSVRDNYRNLLKFLDRAGADSDWFREKYAEDIAEVRELLAFFSDEAVTLSDEAQAAWCKAFVDAKVQKIAPDAWGQFAHFAPAAFMNGVLRKPLEPIARYLESIGVGPDEWADFDVNFFGRGE